MDYLPKIKVDLILEEPEALKEEQEEDEEEESGGTNFIYSDEEESIVPQIQEKNIIPEEDIFVEKKTKKNRCRLKQSLKISPLNQ